MSNTELHALLDEARDTQAELARLLAEGSPLPQVVALFDEIHLAFIAADKTAIKRRVGLVGRILGRDIDTGIRARELRQQAPLLKHRLDMVEEVWRSHQQALTRQQAQLTSLAERLHAARQAAETTAAEDARLAQMQAVFAISQQQLALVKQQQQTLGEAFPALRDGLLSVLAQTDTVSVTQQQQSAFANTLRTLADIKTLFTPSKAETP